MELINGKGGISIPETNLLFGVSEMTGFFPHNLVRKQIMQTAQFSVWYSPKTDETYLELFS